MTPPLARVSSVGVMVSNGSLVDMTRCSAAAMPRVDCRPRETIRNLEETASASNLAICRRRSQRRRDRGGDRACRWRPAIQSRSAVTCSPMTDDLILGAVAYDAKVVPIWDGFRTWFAARGLAFDYILYTSYERQVDAQLRGDVHVAWSSPLAWLQTERAARKHGRTAQAIAMRDTDRDLTSVVLVRGDSEARALADLRGKRVGVGAGASPQATLIPLADLAAGGVRGDVVRHDALLGKHGDHIGGERDAVKALVAGAVDAACILDGNRLAFANEGLLAPGATRVVHHTGAYDHCNMTVLDNAPADPIARFRELLLGMSYQDPIVPPLLDLEGLKQWLPGRTSGYALLDRAVARFGTL